MAQKIPLKANFTGSDVTSLGEFTSGDTIAIGYVPEALPKAGGTMTGAIDFGDNVKANFGNNDDLQIYGNSNSSFIHETGSGHLYVRGSMIILKSQADNDDYMKCYENGSVNLFYSNAEKLATTNTGIDVTGNVVVSGTVDGVDIQTLNTTAGAALPKAGGTMTGTLVATTATTSTDTDTTNTGSVTLDFATNQNFVLTLTGNVTLANPSTEQVGQSGFIAFIQDGTGSRTVSLGTDYETAAAAGLTLTATASATDLVPYLVVASNRILLGTPQLAFA